MTSPAGFAQTNNPASITLAPTSRAAAQGRQAGGGPASGQRGGHGTAAPGTSQPSLTPGSAGQQGSTPVPLSPVAVAVVVEHVRFETRTPPRPPAPSSKLASHVGSGRHTPSPSSQQPQPQPQQQHELVLHSLGLHLACASARGPGWGPGDACDVAGTQLQACGYHCVLHEAALRVRIRHLGGSTTQAPSSTQGSSSQGAGGSAGPAPPLDPNGNRHQGGQPTLQHQPFVQQTSTLDIEVANQQLLGILTQDSAALLLQLSAQLGALIAAGSAKGAGGGPVGSPGGTAGGGGGGGDGCRSPAPVMPNPGTHPGSTTLNASSHMPASGQGTGTAGREGSHRVSSSHVQTTTGAAGHNGEGNGW